MPPNNNAGFVTGTLVKTPAGPKAVESLHPGDEVIGFNETTLEEVIQIIRATSRRYSQNVVQLGCGPGQRIWMHGEFQRADRAFQIMPVEDPPLQLVEINCIPDHTFILASGLHVHNGRGGERSAGTQTQNVIQRNEPSELLSPFLQNIFQEAQGAFGQVQRDPFGGRLGARVFPEQRQALDLTGQLAQNLITELGIGQPGQSILGGVSGGVSTTGRKELLDLALRQLRGEFLTPESNPFLQQTIDIANRSTEEQFLQNILPQLGSAAQRGGAFGGSRQGIVEGLAAGELAQALSDTAGKIAFENFARERGIQQTSGGLLEQAQQMQARAASAQRSAESARLQQLLFPLELLGSVGATRQGLEQSRLDAELQKFLLNRQLTDPFQGLGEFANILNLGGRFGTQSTAGTTGGTIPGMSTGASLLQGGLGATNIAAGIMDLLRGGGGGTASSGGGSTLGNVGSGIGAGAALGSIFPGPGNIIGGILGGIGGLLG